MISSVWVRWPSRDTVATRTATTAMVTVTGARSGCSRACSACSSNSVSSSDMVSAPNFVGGEPGVPARPRCCWTLRLPPRLRSGLRRQASETRVAPLHNSSGWQRTIATNIATNYEDKPSCLFSHDFNDDSFIALAVEFGIENLLPGADIEFFVAARVDYLLLIDQ